MKQSNKMKTPLVFRLGVILLCAMLFSSYLMGGLYARFSSTIMGSASVQAAKIDCTVNYEFSGYGDLGEINGDAGAVFVVEEEFSVENTGEVSYTYDLSLRFSKDVASATFDTPVAPPTGFTLYAPKNVSDVIYVYHSSENASTGATISKKASELTGGAFAALKANKVYYAYSSNGIDYTWVETALMSETLSVPSQTLTIGQRYYYKIVYFIAPAPGVNLTQQQMTLLYNITCTQID